MREVVVNSSSDSGAAAVCLLESCDAIDGLFGLSPAIDSIWTINERERERAGGERESERKRACFLNVD